MYDSGFLWGEVPDEKRIELFEGFAADYLRFAQTPVLVLADEEIQEAIRPVAEKSGFQQVDCPYRIEEVVRKISKMMNNI